MNIRNVIDSLSSRTNRIERELRSIPAEAFQLTDAEQEVTYSTSIVDTYSDGISGAVSSLKERKFEIEIVVSEATNLLRDIERSITAFEHAQFCLVASDDEISKVLQ